MKYGASTNIVYYDPRPEKYRMAQIARKLASKAKPRMVNCDLGHSLFMAEARKQFFCGCGEKTRLCRTHRVREICAFGPQTRK